MRRKTQPVPQVMEGRALGGYRVYLRFKDGVEGEVDLRPILMPFRGVFAELKDPKKFAKFFSEAACQEESSLVISRPLSRPRL
jgi:Protein of unknown function (DUF2442)